MIVECTAVWLTLQLAAIDAGVKHYDPAVYGYMSVVLNRNERTRAEYDRDHLIEQYKKTCGTR